MLGEMYAFSSVNEVGLLIIMKLTSTSNLLI